MGLGSDTYGSAVVNGQNVPVIGSQAINPPAAIGPMFSGPGQAPLPTIPLATGGYTTTGGVAAAGSATNGSASSPMMWLVLVVMFAVGVLGLRFVHWRG